MAMEDLSADGVLIHMLLGKLKPGDIPADVRVASIRKMVDLYFPPNSVMVTGYGFDMLYAGPAKRCCTQCSAERRLHPPDCRPRSRGDLLRWLCRRPSLPTKCRRRFGVEIYRADHRFSKKLGRVVMMRDAPDHSPEDFVLLSGTKVREMLGQGIAPPPEFSRLRWLRF